MDTIYLVPLFAVLALSQEYDCNAPIDGVSEVARSGDDTTFLQASTQFSSLMGETSYLEPDVVAMCIDSDEVVAAVNWAVRCGYKVSIRSGGHNYAGYSSCGPWFNTSRANGCMVIDVSQLEHYDMDDDAQQATFGVGWTLADMYTVRVIAGGPYDM